MKNTSPKHIHEAQELADEMIRMADKIGEICDEDGCLVVYSVIKDCGYKIRGVIERECREVQNQ